MELKCLGFGVGYLGSGINLASLGKQMNVTSLNCVKKFTFPEEDVVIVK